MSSLLEGYQGQLHYSNGIGDKYTLINIHGYPAVAGERTPKMSLFELAKVLFAPQPRPKTLPKKEDRPRKERPEKKVNRRVEGRQLPQGMVVHRSQTGVEYITVWDAADLVVDIVEVAPEYFPVSPEEPVERPTLSLVPTPLAPLEQDPEIDVIQGWYISKHIDPGQPFWLIAVRGGANEHVRMKVPPGEDCTHLRRIWVKPTHKEWNPETGRQETLPNRW